MKTTARTPRANSTFKTNEKRETYRMKLEILDILSTVKEGEPTTAVRIINKANSLGYCRPLIDSKRIADAHPYWKILSDMTDPASPLFVNNLEEMDGKDVLEYRLRTDVVRTKSGVWKKVKGQELTYPMPKK